jgi:3-hydroxybutyrate dehydrogenase
MDYGLRGRVAIVTGGSNGLGLAFVQALCQEEVRVVLSDIDDQRGKLAEEALKSNGATAMFHRSDVADRQQVRSLIESTIATFGKIDILINNAGLQHISPIHEFDEDQWDRLISVMLTGPFLTTKYALPHMRAKRYGRIINVASIHALVASEFKSAYVAAKHGLVGFNKVLALEGAPFNITAVAICPSYVRTALVEKQLAGQAKQLNIPEAEVLEKVMLAPSPLKRLLEPSEVAALAVYLCSDLAQGITGSTIPIDCGWTAR